MGGGRLVDNVQRLPPGGYYWYMGWGRESVGLSLPRSHTAGRFLRDIEGNTGERQRVTVTDKLYNL